MSRANRRRPERRAPDLERALGGLTRRERHADGEWFVRVLAGREPGRRYRCPGCQQEFVGTVSHVVAWPADGVGGVDNRRHWHTPCWRNRAHRHPRGSFR
ncbi:MAG: hypothetical protein ABI746_03820 [Dermatophilaceae bacterium]